MAAKKTSLTLGYSRKTFEQNYRVLRLQDGYPQAQALAIAYETARKAFYKKHPRGVLPVWLQPVKAEKVKRKTNPAPDNRSAIAIRIADWCTAKKFPLPVYSAMMYLVYDNPAQWRGKDINDLYAQALKTMPGRKINPVKPTLEQQKKSAASLYHKFTGHKVNRVVSIDKPELPDVMSVIGDVDGILYTTVRDGKTERYIHEFSPKSRPLFCVSPDGKQLHMIGGKYNFTERGIVDRT